MARGRGPGPESALSGPCELLALSRQGFPGPFGPTSDVDLLIDLSGETVGSLWTLLTLRDALKVPGERLDLWATTALKPDVLEDMLASAIRLGRP